MRKLRAWASRRVHRVLRAAVTSALEPIDGHLRQLNERLSALEGLAIRIEAEEQALRQQVDEALDFLRVQHFAVREALEIKSDLKTSDRAGEPDEP
jgi:hypothetical protein